MKTQEERVNYLIDVLKNETNQYKNMEIPESIEDKKVMLRSLMNVR